MLSFLGHQASSPKVQIFSCKQEWLVTLLVLNKRECKTWYTQHPAPAISILANSPKQGRFRGLESVPSFGESVVEEARGCSLKLARPEWRIAGQACAAGGKEGLAKTFLQPLCGSLDIPRPICKAEQLRPLWFGCSVPKPPHALALAWSLFFF